MMTDEERKYNNRHGLGQPGMRGHLITFDWLIEEYVYNDTGEITFGSRPCVRCGKPPTPEGHDACIGYIEGVYSACCGHGMSELGIHYYQSEQDRINRAEGEKKEQWKSWSETVLRGKRKVREYPYSPLNCIKWKAGYYFTLQFNQMKDQIVRIKQISTSGPPIINVYTEAVELIAENLQWEEQNRTFRG